MQARIIISLIFSECSFYKLLILSSLKYCKTTIVLVVE